MNKYNIYVVNNQTSEQTFWCFLAAPQATSTSDIYANSSTFLTVESGNTNLNKFMIPVQYVFQAGASNQAVGLNIEITSTATDDVNLGDQWCATFHDPAKHQGPDLAQYGSVAPSGTLQYQTSNYDQSQEPVVGWYASETFGIQTAAGFIGVTWAPQAGHTVTVTPKLEFYIATGNYTENTLADMANVSTKSQTVRTSNFDAAFNCTVTIDASGNWSVAKGKPPGMHDHETESLIESHLLLTRAHEHLVITTIGNGAQETLSLAALEQ